MKVLLDTHVLVWALTEPDRLSASARQAMEASQIFVSVASLWEMILKKSKKDGLVQDPLPWWNRNIVGSGIHIVPILGRHVAIVDTMPELHKDPFDRILLAQAIVEGATILSRDRALAAYGVPVIW